MTDTFNDYGTDGRDEIDARKPPLKGASFGVYRTGKGNDTIVLVAGKVAVGGAGDDTIIGVGGGIRGVKYDESPTGIDLNASEGTVKDGHGSTDTLRGINDFSGSAHDDII